MLKQVWTNPGRLSLPTLRRSSTAALEAAFEAAFEAGWQAAPGIAMADSMETTIRVEAGQPGTPTYARSGRLECRNVVAVRTSVQTRDCVTAATLYITTTTTSNNTRVYSLN